MILDSSALVAMILREPEQLRFSDAIAAVAMRRVSAASLLETSIVIEGRSGEQGGKELDELVAELDLQVVPFTAEQAALAREAFRCFGKGRHPARLNFGDCMAYALATDMGEPLLFKGDDFSRTDIEAATY